MTLKSWIENIDPSKLIVLGDSWITFGTDLEHLFDRYVDAVTKVNGTYWNGQCATAAQERAQADQKTMQTLADKINAVAQRVKQGYDEIDAPLRRARGALIEAAHRSYSIADTLALSIPPGKSVTDEDKQALLVLQDELNDAVRCTVQADSKVRDDLNNARAELRTAFVATAALGVEQGKADGANLTDSPMRLGPDGVQRLIEAGQLTPEQVAALQGGDAATIPASQMEYLTQISRSLDSKSPQEIEQIMTKLPPDGQRALANSFQIVSNEKINAGVTNDPAIPKHGGADQLPKQIQTSLTRKDLVVNQFHNTAGGTTRSIELNGVADNQAVANMVRVSDPQLRNGSAIDSELLDVGRQYLGAQVNHEQLQHNALTSFTLDGNGASDTSAITEGIFNAVGQDKVAVESVVTGPNGKDFVSDALSHQWPDDGKAVSSLFTFGDKDATVEDPGNPADVQSAMRTGRIMQSVAEATSTDEAWKLLSNVPNTDGQSAGQLNPDLLQSISKSMSPYVSDLAGADQPDKPGFNLLRSDHTSWADPNGNNSFSGSANIFALMNTDENAGKDFNGAAVAEVLRQETKFGVDPTNPDAGGWLSTAGRLHGLVDKGNMIEVQDQYDDRHAQEEASYKRKAAWFDAGKAAFSFGSGFGDTPEKFAYALVNGSGDSLKDAFTGGRPGAAALAGLSGTDFYRDDYAILKARQDIGLSLPQIPAQQSWMLDGSGRLLDYEQMRDKLGNDPQRKDAFEWLVTQLGGGDGHQIRNGYSDVVRKDG
ncbi:TPR repeat region-containing protein [Nocardia pseudovaccinii]|uniref:TPR repeat region-containing protein n=1 Tax=Nocardia pseudovaccinii TaxID=189540 RepID=UPI0007A44FFB|nr:hypothetical protein [Nocardia pseudovaccinii]